MVKCCIAGFIAYSAGLLALLYIPELGAMTGPLPAVILGAFWWPYAFVTVAMVFYAYDLPVARFFGPPMRLQRMLINRMAERHTVR